MRQSRIRDVLRRVQDIAKETTGARLPKQAEERLRPLLEALAAPGANAPGDEFSHQAVTILLADLRGFMAMTATQPAAAVLALLNRCFGRLSEIIVAHGGVIDKFMGDAILVIFPRQADRRAEDARCAIHCAVDMQVALEQLNAQRKEDRLPPLYMGIGINTGTVLAGIVGSELYSAYTVIGEDVNLASRIEAFSLRGQVLISQSTYAHADGFASTAEPMDVYVKGKAERVRLHEVLGLPGAGKTVPRQELRRSPRVVVSLPFTCQLVHNKIVKPAVLRASIVDIGYYGLLAEVESALPVRAELKIALDLPLVGHRTEDIYARVVKHLLKDGRHQVGLEFTSLAPQTNEKLQLFVQMLIQGHEAPGLPLPR
jgi:adenylate cyclase